jgi:hypothetical protein
MEEKVVSRDLDLSVLPLRGPVVARDQAHAVQPTEVAEKRKASDGPTNRRPSR